MKCSSVGIMVTLLALLLLESRLSTDARLLENDFFLGTGNPSAFNPELNSVMGEASMTAIVPVEKTGLPCDEAGLHPWKESPQNSTNDTNVLTFTFKDDRPDGDTKESSRAEQAVYHVLPKGRVMPSGPSPKGNVAVNAERLAKSEHSPGVGHMQVFKAKSRSSGSADHMQDGSKKRIQESTPSPGGGH